MNIASILGDAEQDQLLSEVKTYFSYTICHQYVEQQEINTLVLKVVAKVVEVKAMAMLSQNASKLQEFCDQYFSILSAAFMRVYTSRNDVAFANDVVF